MALPELIVNSPTPGVQEPIATLAEALTEEGGTVKLSQPMPAGLQGTGQTRLLIDHEIILIEGSASPNVTVITRGAEGTAKAIHAVNTKVYHVPTAEGLRRALAPSLVSALPGSPIDGQEVYYQNTAMGESGVTWLLRYRAASASTHKWEFVGGPDWTKGPSGTVTITAIEEKPLEGGPEIVVPLTGDYVANMAMSMQLNVEGLQELFGLLCKNGVAIATPIILTTNPTFSRLVASGTSGPISLAAADKLTLAGKNAFAKSAGYGLGVLSLSPIRVG
jgi:hypothetical protein